MSSESWYPECWREERMVRLAVEAVRFYWAFVVGCVLRAIADAW